MRHQYNGLQVNKLVRFFFYPSFNFFIWQKTALIKIKIDFLIKILECDDDIYLSSLRQLDKNISAAIATSSTSNVIHPATALAKTTIRSSFNPNNRLSFMSTTHNPRSFANSSSFHQNLNNISSFGDNYLVQTRAFPYDRMSQNRLTSISSKQQINMPISNSNNNTSFNNRANSSCKIYQDLDEFKGHLDELKGHMNEFKGHLV